ncbi:PD-(D/E)XK nuclease family protein, partial [uncultured Sphingomonas sp.]|uniref:PD-(D/E)XK nuclease family protein n=1 Tax=uncultured Sphingomonas sp. TaxID=158754 RepID=UPI002586655A
GAVPAAAVPVRAAREAAVPAGGDLPEWTRRMAPHEQLPPRPLSPSAVGDDEVADPPPTPAMRAAAERGRLMHALFERLPALPAGQRAAAADAWLAARGVADRAVIIAPVLAVMEDAAFADLFAPDVLVEAPISAMLPSGRVIAGTIDRLLVADGRVRVIDYKTGRRVPVDAAGVPDFHVRQMAAYHTALEVIFPGHVIEAALLYTAGPRLVTLPPDMLEAAKARFAGPEQSLADGG